MLAIDYLPAARRDFDESFDRYAERSPQAATKFTLAVEAALAKIAANPTAPQCLDDVHREFPVRVFPFRIVYRVVESGLLVVAIVHSKRRPGFWRNRA